MYAPQEAEAARGNGESEGEEGARPPTPSAQQLPVYDGIEWQQGGALPFPVYHYTPYHVPYTVPLPNQYAYPLHFADPYAGLYYEFLYAPHYEFPSTGFYSQCACLFPYAFPLNQLYAVSHNYLHPFPSVDPYAFPQALTYLGFLDNHDALDGYSDYFENMNGGEISYFNVTGLASSVENIGPLPLENSPEFSFSHFCSPFPEASEYPSTSGISFSNRRCKEESSDEEAAKRPRWSPE